MIAPLRQHDAALTTGALVVVDEKKSRVRVQPLYEPSPRRRKRLAYRKFRIVSKP